MNAEYIESLRNATMVVRGDPDHTKFVTDEDIRSDVLECIPDTIITTVKLSVVVTDLLKERWIVTGTRQVQGIECAEFMMLAPFAMRVAVLGTNFCPQGEYIMFRSRTEETGPQDILLRRGIQG